jgi:excisionase family DNA binding protein
METEKLLAQLWTPEMIAKRMNVSVFTVYRWIKAKKIKIIKLTARNFRIEEKDLNNFIKQHKK